MTRKDYVLLAEHINPLVILARRKVLTGFEILDYVGSLADALERDNPNFDADRFKQACYKDKEKSK